MNYRKDRYNGSGCLDMTAYLALRNISRDEHKQFNNQRRKEATSAASTGVKPARKKGAFSHA